MTDLEISKALALAIGWELAEVDWDDYNSDLPAHISVWSKASREWRAFDYRDWNVIGPIAERYDCFPYMNTKGQWVTGYLKHDHHYADTPQKAIALAVIEGAAHKIGVQE